MTRIIIELDCDSADVQELEKQVEHCFRNSASQGVKVSLVSYVYTNSKQEGSIVENWMAMAKTFNTLARIKRL
jgi:hypothetical protein